VSRVALTGRFAPAITPEVEEDLYNRHCSGESAKELSAEVGLAPRSLYARFRRSGRAMGPRNNERRLKVVDTFFEQIDSPEKAYWLGLLAADGNVTRPGTRPRASYSVKLTVAALDKELPERMHQLLGGSLRTLVSQGKYPQVACSVTSDPLGNDLIKFGVTPNKSLTMRLRWELIPSNLRIHTLYGLIDGDGWITRFTGKNGGRVALAMGSLDVISDISSEFPKFVFKDIPTKTGRIYQLSIDAQAYLLEFLQGMLAVPHPTLSRKREKAEAIVDNLTNKPAPKKSGRKPATKETTVV